MKNKIISIILSVLALLLFICSSFMPTWDIYMIIHAIVFTIGFFAQIALIVLIVRNRNK
ncbi:MAG: hypothetical protein ACFFCY_00700 [Promethearchaeota archaeon]